MIWLILAVAGCKQAQPESEPVDTGEPRVDCLSMEPASVQFDDVRVTVDPPVVATVTLVNPTPTTCRTSRA